MTNKLEIPVRLFRCLGHMCSQFCSELFHWLSMLRHYVLCRPGLCKAGESESEVTQSCPTLCDPMDCSRPGSSVHGIFQAIVLELIAISFSRGSSQPRDQTQVSLIIDRRFTVWTTSFSLILVPTCWMGLAFPWGCITSWYGLKNLKRDCVLQYISIFHEGGHI